MHSLKSRIILTSLIVVVLSNFIIGFVSTNISRSSLEHQMEKALKENVHATAESIQASNEKEFKMLETLGSLPQIRDSEETLLEKTHTIYGAMSLDKDYVDVCILDKDGIAWINNGVKQIPFSEREYYKVPYKTGKRYMTDPFINKVDGTMAIFYSIPVFDTNNVISNVLFCVVDGFKPSYLAVEHQAGNGRSASIVSLDTGLVIASENHDLVASEAIFENADASVNENYIACMNEIRNGNTGVSKYTLDGKRYICAYEKIEGTNWMAMNAVPYEDFESDIKKTTTILIFIIVVMTIICLVVSAFVVSLSIKPLENVRNSINEIASGNADLTKRIHHNSKDEVGAVVDGFNRFTEKLQGIIADIKRSNTKLELAGADLQTGAEDTGNSIAEIISNIEAIHVQINSQGDSVSQTAGAVNEIASNIESLEHMIESQSMGVSQASSAVEEMIGNINSVSNSMDKMAKSFEKLSERTNTGTNLQLDANERIERIKNQSETLQEANLAIASISEQTNLLAMNAAIEAAHAGEAGKGFSVVADEIRKLSETSREQSKTIGDQLTSIRESIEEMVEASQKSTDAFQSVSVQIKETDELVNQMKAAMEEQSVGSRQISTALHNMNDSTFEVKNASKEMAEGNKSILLEVRNLQEATGTIKESMNVVASSVKKIKETGETLNDISSKMMTNISDIGSQIGQFNI